MRLVITYTPNTHSLSTHSLTHSLVRPLMHSLTHSLTHSLAPYRPKLEVQEIRGRAQGHTGHQRPAGTWGVGRVSTFQCNDCCLLVGRIRWYPANSMQQSVVNSSFGWLVSPGCQAHCRERFAHDRRGDAAEAFRTVLPSFEDVAGASLSLCFQLGQYLDLF